MRLHAVLLALVLLLVGCSEPTIEVCRRLDAAGRCDVPVTELDTGAQHVLLVRKLRAREVEVRLVKLEDGHERTLGTRVVRAVEGHDTIGVPLTLPRTGDYRVDVMADGDVIATQRLRAPNAAAHPVPTP